MAVLSYLVVQIQVALVSVAGCDCDYTLRTHFAFDSAELTAEDKAQLDRLAEVLMRPELDFVAGEIVGHTDSVGDAAYNTQLSKRRADAVASHLKSRGVVLGDRFTTRGMGEDDPIADNATEDGRAQNRRVTIRRLDCGSANAPLGGGEAPKRRADGAGRLDPHEMPGALDHLEPGAWNPLGPVRRGGDRHRAPRAVYEADGDTNPRQPRFESRQLGLDRRLHTRQRWCRLSRFPRFDRLFGGRAGQGQPGRGRLSGQ